MRCDAAALFFHIVSLFCKSQILAEKLRKFSQAIFRLHFSEGRGRSSSSSSCCSCCSCFARCRCRCGPRSCSWSICQQTECCWHFPRSLTILIYLVFWASATVGFLATHFAFLFASPHSLPLSVSPSFFFSLAAYAPATRFSFPQSALKNIVAAWSDTNCAYHFW